MSDPLNRVFADDPANERAFREEIRDLLIDYIWLDGKGQVNFTTEYFNLNLPGRVFLYLMGRWVLADKKLRPDGASLTEIETETRINSNSLRPTLGTLLDLGAIRKSGGHGAGEYRAVPSHAWKVKIKKGQS